MMDIKERKSLARKYAISTKAQAGNLYAQFPFIQLSAIASRTENNKEKMDVKGGELFRAEIRNKF